jgi:hypothetical protein
MGKPDSLRAFMTSPAFFQPPSSVLQTVHYTGNEDQPDRVLVAMRCRPKDPAVLQAALATWPTVFQAITEDLQGKELSCPATEKVENKIFCLAQSYKDTPRQSVAAVLQPALRRATRILAAKDATADGKSAARTGGEWLLWNYGIYPGFSGLGSTLRDSAQVGDARFPAKSKITASDVFTQSVIPEYLVKNVTLAEGGCSCIFVRPYAERAAAALDPDLIPVKAPAPGRCVRVDRLPAMP